MLEKGSEYLFQGFHFLSQRVIEVSGFKKKTWWLVNDGLSSLFELELVNLRTCRLFLCMQNSNVLSISLVTNSLVWHTVFTWLRQNLQSLFGLKHIKARRLNGAFLLGSSLSPFHAGVWSYWLSYSMQSKKEPSNDSAFGWQRLPCPFLSHCRPSGAFAVG